MPTETAYPTTKNNLKQTKLERVVGMKALINEARRLIVDAQSIDNLSSSNLRCKSMHEQILNLVNVLDYKRTGSIKDKVKNVLFEDTEKETEQEKQLTDLVYRLKNCVKCECASCLKITDECKCKSCVYGAYTVSCDGIVRVSSVDSEVVSINGYSDIELLTDIQTGKMTANGVSNSGVYKTNIKVQ